MSTGWRWATAIYVAFFIIVVLIEGHGFSHRPMTPIERILTAPFLWGIAIHGLQEGSTMGRFARVDRSESPIYFWTLVTVQIIAGFFVFGWGLRDAFR
jgi:hypothetical protein